MENSADALQTIKGENAACPSSRSWSETLSSAAHTMYEDVKAVAANPIAQDVAGVAVIAGAMYLSRGRVLEETAGKLLPEASSVMEGLGTPLKAATRELIDSGIPIKPNGVASLGKDALYSASNPNLAMKNAGESGVRGVQDYLKGTPGAATLAARALGGDAIAAGRVPLGKELLENGLAKTGASHAAAGALRGPIFESALAPKVPVSHFIPRTTGGLEAIVRDPYVGRVIPNLSAADVGALKALRPAGASKTLF